MAKTKVKNHLGILYQSSLLAQNGLLQTNLKTKNVVVFPFFCLINSQNKKCWWICCLKSLVEPPKKKLFFSVAEPPRSARLWPSWPRSVPPPQQLRCPARRPKPRYHHHWRWPPKVADELEILSPFCIAGCFKAFEKYSSNLLYPKKFGKYKMIQNV